MAAEFPLPYTLRRSARAKRLRLVVKPAGLELVMPAGMDEATALGFLHRNREWALQQVQALQARLPAGAPAGLAPTGTVPFQGREVPLVITQQAGRRARIAYDEGFTIAVPEGTPEQAEQWAKAALLAWVKTWLAAESRRIVDRQGPRFGLVPRHLRIKAMRTRWGSCGPQGDINLNQTLAFAPPAALEYVVVHELCHLRHRNHSSQFWSLVAAHLPDFRDHRLWLRHYGGELLRRFG
jgi:predicted metal-dependent hydrolase